eukprot:g2208.t1
MLEFLTLRFYADNFGDRVLPVARGVQPPAPPPPVPVPVRPPRRFGLCSACGMMLLLCAKLALLHTIAFAIRTHPFLRQVNGTVIANAAEATVPRGWNLFIAGGRARLRVTASAGTHASLPGHATALDGVAQGDALASLLRHYDDSVDAVRLPLPHTWQSLFEEALPAPLTLLASEPFAPSLPLPPLEYAVGERVQVRLGTPVDRWLWQGARWANATVIAVYPARKLGDFRYAVRVVGDGGAGALFAGGCAGGWLGRWCDRLDAGLEGDGVPPPPPVASARGGKGWWPARAAPPPRGGAGGGKGVGGPQPAFQYKRVRVTVMNRSAAGLLHVRPGFWHHSAVPSGWSQSARDALGLDTWLAAKEKPGEKKQSGQSQREKDGGGAGDTRDTNIGIGANASTSTGASARASTSSVEVGADASTSAAAAQGEPRGAPAKALSPEATVHNASKSEELVIVRCNKHSQCAFDEFCAHRDFKSGDPLADSNHKGICFVCQYCDKHERGVNQNCPCGPLATGEFARQRKLNIPTVTVADLPREAGRAGPAELAGLKVNDTILAIGGVSVGMLGEGGMRVPNDGRGWTNRSASLLMALFNSSNIPLEIEVLRYEEAGARSRAAGGERGDGDGDGDGDGNGDGDGDGDEVEEQVARGESSEEAAADSDTGVKEPTASVTAKPQAKPRFGGMQDGQDGVVFVMPNRLRRPPTVLFNSSMLELDISDCIRSATPAAQHRMGAAVRAFFAAPAVGVVPLPLELAAQWAPHQLDRNATIDARRGHCVARELEPHAKDQDARVLQRDLLRPGEAPPSEPEPVPYLATLFRKVDVLTGGFAAALSIAWDALDDSPLDKHTASVKKPSVTLPQLQCSRDTAASIARTVLQLGGGAGDVRDVPTSAPSTEHKRVATRWFVSCGTRIPFFERGRWWVGWRQVSHVLRFVRLAANAFVGQRLFTAMPLAVMYTFTAGVAFMELLNVYFLVLVCWYVPIAYAICALLRHIDTPIAPFAVVAAISMYVNVAMILLTEFMSLLNVVLGDDGYEAKEKALSSLRGRHVGVEQLVTFYKKHEPTKVKDAKGILATYKRDEMLSAIWDKYGALPAGVDEGGTCRDAEAEAKAETASGPAQQEEQEQVCRICYEPACAELGELMSPCLCRGSVRFVHAQCLRTWRFHSANPASRYECDSCSFRYVFRRSWKAAVFRSALVLHVHAFIGLVALTLIAGYMAKGVDEFVFGNIFDSGARDMLRSDLMQLVAGDGAIAHAAVNNPWWAVDVPHMLSGAAFIGFISFLSFGMFGPIFWNGGGGHRGGGMSLIVVAVAIGLARAFFLVLGRLTKLSGRYWNTGSEIIVNVEEALGLAGGEDSDDEEKEAPFVLPEQRSPPQGRDRVVLFEGRQVPGPMLPPLFHRDDDNGGGGGDGGGEGEGGGAGGNGAGGNGDVDGDGDGDGEGDGDAGGRNIAGVVPPDAPPGANRGGGADEDIAAARARADEEFARRLQREELEAARVQVPWGLRWMVPGFGAEGQAGQQAGAAQRANGGGEARGDRDGDGALGEWRAVANDPWVQPANAFVIAVVLLALLTFFDASWAGDMDADQSEKQCRSGTLADTGMAILTMAWFGWPSGSEVFATEHATS